MAGLHLDGLGAHALGHETFEIRIDRPVFRGNGIETRLRPPGRMRGLSREESLLERLLDRGARAAYRAEPARHRLSYLRRHGRGERWRAALAGRRGPPHPCDPAGARLDNPVE
jgi:hypothetical protein